MRALIVSFEPAEPNRDEFPHLKVTGEIYEIDRDRHTSAGGTGTLDVMLALIATQHGETLASQVAAWHPPQLPPSRRYSVKSELS